MIQFYRRALPLLQAAEANVEALVLGAKTVESKLQMGIPLLVGEALPVDVEASKELFLRLCQLLEDQDQNNSEKKANQTGSNSLSLLSFFAWKKRDSSKSKAPPPSEDLAPSASEARKIRNAAQQEKLDLSELWLALLAGNTNQLQEIALLHSLHLDLLQLLGQQSLFPSLRVWAKQVQRLADIDQLWQRGFCPMCGSMPILGEIQGKEGARRLRCAACAASWHYPRLQCVYCATKNHRQIGYISIEGEDEKYRVQTCDLCKGYLKLVTTFDPIAAGLLAIEDLQTAHLDTIASERQFQRILHSAPLVHAQVPTPLQFSVFE